MIQKFLESVLGTEGFYCVVGIGEGKPIQKFYDSIDKAVATAEDFDKQGLNAYYALATFSDDKARKQLNAHQLRSLFLDIDCGVGKDYPTQSEALTELRKFCKHFKLPKPTIVNSGRGIHVYWPLTEPILRDDWIPVAESLKRVCRNFPLHIDPVVTADSARILRVPGTHNYKDTPPKEVAILGEADQPVDIDKFKELIGFDAVKVLGSSPFVPHEVSGVTSIIAGNESYSFKKILKKCQEGAGCSNLAYAINNQAEMSETMWRATLSIAAFCEESEKAIHKVSFKHPGYTPEATSEKAGRIKGPYRCERFEEYFAEKNPDGCATCPNRGKITGPIKLGKVILEATEEEEIEVPTNTSTPNAPTTKYVVPTYPYPYFRGANGGVYKRTTNRDGEPVEVLVYYNDIYVTRRLRDEELGESIAIRLHLPKDGVREFTVPLASVLAKDEFRKNFAAQGVSLLDMSQLMEYIARWVNELQTKVSADEARTQFGWTGDEKNLRSFVLGDREIFADRVELNAPSGKTVKMIKKFGIKGSMEEWKKTIEFFNQPNFEAHQYMFGLSLGAPLMRILEVNGAIFHAHSKDSGFGKTTAMYAGASVWGSPDDLVMEEKDTYNSKMNNAERLKNIVFYMDEMTNTPGKDLSDLAYSIPGGKQRNRLSGGSSNMERDRGDPWHSLCGTTGNTSMIEKIMAYKALPKAEAQRILECRMEQTFFGDKSVTDEFYKNIKRCYGHVGQEYVQYILQNQDYVKGLLASTQKAFDKKAGLVAANRFWSAQSACVLTGMIIAKKLGFITFNLSALANWLAALINKNKEFISGMGGDVETILTDYLSSHYNNILRIRSTDDNRGKADIPGIEEIIIPDGTPRSAMVARYEYDIKKLYLFIKPLQDWCIKQQINYSGFIDGLRTGRTAAKNVTKRMGKGTRMNLGSVTVLEVNWSGFDEDVQEPSTELFNS